MNPFIRIIPPALVRAFANRYVAGDSLTRAIDVAAELRESDLFSSLDLLAEDIEDQSMATRNLDIYMRMVDQVANDTRFERVEYRPTLSLKLSSYTVAPLDRGGDAAGSREAVNTIVTHATKRDIGITIDMESSHWTDFTLETLGELHRRGHTHVGCVLQTRLERTQTDAQSLPLGCRVRVVIGIYQEPAEVATQDKTEMKERLLRTSRELLRRGHYVELGTHDEVYIRRFLDEVVPDVGADPSQFEIQMLYGVPREKLQRELKEAGVTTRLYVPFAVGWPMAISYLRRRLDEYPKMMFLVAKNLFTGE